MTRLQFDVVGREHGDPVRSRSVFAGSAAFWSDKSPAVLVAPMVVEQLRAAARKASPDEVGGLLVGRCFRDEDGPYVVTLGFVQALASDGVPGSITLSAERTSELRKQAAQQHPSMDVVGWWHSHLAPSGFSSTDRQSQRLWSQPMHVGLLVFAAGVPWAHAYLGPNAVELRPMDGVVLGPPSSIELPAPRLGLLRKQAPRADAAGARVPRARPDLTLLLTIAVLGLMASVLLLALAVVRLTGL
jgi:proteasome lid subunit RPN8/RPN11